MCRRAAPPAERKRLDKKSRKIRGNSYFYAKFSVQFKASDQGKQTNRQTKEESLSSMKSKFSNRCYLYLYTYKFY